MGSATRADIAIAVDLEKRLCDEPLETYYLVRTLRVCYLVSKVSMATGARDADGSTSARSQTDTHAIALARASERAS